MHIFQRIIVVAFWVTIAVLLALWLASAMGWIPIGIQPFEPAVIILMIITPCATHRWWRSNTDRNNKTQQSYRRILIESVSNNWIKGVLEETLKDARFDIKLDTRIAQAGDPRERGFVRPAVDHDKPTALKALINAVLRRNNERKSLTGAAQAIPQIFRDASDKLLILGAPGSGKTVLLLELAKALLQAANKDATKSVPVVFNLSSWAVKRQPLRDWLIVELRRNYGIGKQLAKQWIDDDSLIYLLDGFDEVVEEHRKECLNTINTFILPTRQIVVCSRIEEYDLLSDKLNIHGAIELLPLGKDQVLDVLKQYLRTHTAKAIMKWLSTDDTVWQEVSKPLFVNILINTYIGDKQYFPQALATGRKQEIHQLIIEPFLKQQLRNNPNAQTANENTWRYLSWIAHNLENRNLSQFYVEMIQGDWLHSRNQNLRSKYSFYRFVESLNIDLGWKVRISLQRARFALFHVVKRNFIFVLTMLILSTIVSILGNELPESLFLFVLAICASLLIGALIGSLVDYTLVHQRVGMNQGLNDTLKLALSIGFIAGILASLYSGPMMGILAATIGSLFPGRLSNVIKHVILRFVLYRQKIAPRRYDYFFQMVVNRRIMRRVGGSVLFRHRYIQEYFADQWKQKYQRKYDG